jgi:hypothetical protein
LIGFGLSEKEALLYLHLLLLIESVELTSSLFASRLQPPIRIQPVAASIGPLLKAMSRSLQRYCYARAQPHQAPLVLLGRLRSQKRRCFLSGTSRSKAARLA